MADQHDEALAWAQANSQDPRAQDVMAKAWASQNSNDPRSAAILQKLGASAPPLGPNSTPESLKEFLKYSTGKPSSYQPTKIEQDTQRMALEAGTGGLQQMAGEGLGSVVKAVGSGLGKVGDFAMQKAVGLKRIVPGVGQTLADEGVMGTKGMMRSQVEKAMEAKGQQIGELAKSSPAIDTRPVAERLGGKAASLMDSEGSVLPDNQTAYRKYLEAATGASNEGSISGEVAATRRTQYGKIARDAGRYRDNPGQGIKAQLAGEQQAGYSQALKEANPDIVPVDKAYGNLSTANQAMARPESITPLSLAGKSLPALIGGGVAGLPGAAAGAALSTPLAQSVIGRSLIGLGKGVNATLPAAKLAPATLQELLRRNQSQDDGQ